MDKNSRPDRIDVLPRSWLRLRCRSCWYVDHVDHVDVLAAAPDVVPMVWLYPPYQYDAVIVVLPHQFVLICVQHERMALMEAVVSSSLSHPNIIQVWYMLSRVILLDPWYISTAEMLVYQNEMWLDAVEQAEQGRMWLDAAELAEQGRMWLDTAELAEQGTFVIKTGIFCTLLF
jgi:hypothetical protein